MIKHFAKIVALLVLMFALTTQAQTNLVPNPSFETYTVCPYNQGQVPNATGWIAGGDSPDYFNSCDTNVPDFSVPHNWGGYQIPASGNAYCGIGTYLSEKFTPNTREFIGASLSVPLTNGTEYFVSFKTSLAIDTGVGNCATNNLGAMFTINAPVLGDPYLGTYIPKINYANLITDTVGWTTVFGSFIADSAYQYIFIGNFYTDNNTDTLIINNNDTTVINGKNICYSYYYIDDVCLSTDSIFTKNYTWTGIEGYHNNQQQINLYPNPSVNGIFYTTVTLFNEQIEVFDVLGKSLNKFYVNGNIIDLSYLENGIYIIEINKSKQKLIINK